MKDMRVLFMVMIMVLMSSCTSSSESFYKDKEAIKYMDEAPELNEAFRMAMEESEEFNGEIKDSYVVYGFHDIDFYCKFCILTENDDYKSFQVDDANRIFWICEGTPSELREMDFDSEIGKYVLKDGVLYHVTN